MDELTIIRQDRNPQAVVFVHGFTGHRDETWDRFPGLLGTVIPNWDIFTVNYPTSWWPDVAGVWSADPDIPASATLIRSQLERGELQGYERLALVAHSMGGLVLQRMLLDDAELVSRVSNLIMFGTPSMGLEKAWWAQLWKRQIKNMAKTSDFILNLRRDWTTQFSLDPPFRLAVVAGARDQFVPPDGALKPFRPEYCYVAPGNHLEIVKPGTADSLSLRVVAYELEAVSEPASTPITQPLSIADSPEDYASGLAERGSALSEREVVTAALKFERSGRRDQALALLEQYSDLGTDVKGALAGQLKRDWLLSGDTAQAERALDLYANSLFHAMHSDEPDQIYYHAINVAFFSLVYANDREMMKNAAQTALRGCERADRGFWTTATRAEASLYLGNRQGAVDLYRQTAGWQPVPLNLDSTATQAAQIAMALGDNALLDDLDRIFSPWAGEVDQLARLETSGAGAALQG